MILITRSKEPKMCLAQQSHSEAYSCEILEYRGKKKILHISRQEKIVAHLVLGNRRAADFSLPTVEARKPWSNIFQNLQENYVQCGIPYLINYLQSMRVGQSCIQTHKISYLLCLLSLLRMFSTKCENKPRKRKIQDSEDTRSNTGLRQGESRMMEQEDSSMAV